jgi:hypothetical protein
MPSRWHAAVAALAALTLSSCGESPAPGSDGTSEQSASADGEVDELVDTHWLGDVEGTDADVEGLVVDATGAPVAAVRQPRSGSLSFVRLGADDGWTTAALPGEAPAYLLGMDAADDGTVIAVLDQGGRFAVVRVAPDGELVTAQLPAEIGSDGAGWTTAAASADGGAVYLTLEYENTDDARLLAVDTAAGTVTAEVPLDPEKNSVALEVAPSGDVLLAYEQAHPDDGATPGLARFDVALAPVTDLLLADDPALQPVVDLAVSADGAAYVTVITGSAGEGEVRLLSVAAGTTAPEVVAGWPGDGYFAALETDDELVVDPASEVAWLLRAPGTIDDLDVDLTRVDLGTGEVDDPITVAEGAEDSDLAVSADGTRVFVAGRGQLDDGRIGPVVWVVG